MNKQGPRETGILLMCGIAAALVFIGSVLIQAATRAGYDFRRAPLSLLTLGEHGWIQIATFVVTGLLVIACAIGMRWHLGTGRGRTWGPLLIGVYGVGCIAAGIFIPDPSMGFPPGTPASISSAPLSWHAQVHGAAFDLSFLALIAACFVFARRFGALGQRGWAAFCLATGVAAPALIVLAIVNLSTVGGVLFFATGALADVWLAIVAARLLVER